MENQNPNKEFCDRIDRHTAEILSSPPVDKNVRGKYDFKKDKIEADKGENFIISHLESLGFKFVRKSIKNENDENKEFDLLMSYKEKHITYEVKTDMWPDTGNLVVEFENSNGLPSGIMVTKSDYFTTYFTKLEEIWNIKTEVLKKLILENELPVVGPNKKKPSSIYLLPREKFREYFKVHKL